MIQLNKVHRHYVMASETIRALDGITLSIKEGERIILLGPSGSGKTTLLNCISGLDTPTSGEYLFDGISVTGNSEDLTTFRRKNVGYVFQFFNLLQKAVNALPNLKNKSKQNKEFEQFFTDERFVDIVSY